MTFRERIAAKFGRDKSPPLVSDRFQGAPIPAPRVGLQNMPNEILAQVALVVATANPDNWKETARNLNTMRQLNRYMRNMIEQTPGVKEVLTTLNEAGPVAQKMYKDIYPGKRTRILENLGGNHRLRLKELKRWRHL